MIYRKLSESTINPITGQKYKSNWAILKLTESKEYFKMCGSNNGSAYTIKISRFKCKDWKMAVGDFMGFNEVNGKNSILVMSETSFEKAKIYFGEHRYNESLLR